MSMLSGLADKLRVLAKAIDVRVTEHPVIDDQELSSTLREAADIIEDLRERVYDLEHEIRTPYRASKWYICPNCGHCVSYDILNDGKRAVPVFDYLIILNYCPRCGQVIDDQA